MKICIIGNSHASMLLTAAQQHDFGAHFTFFGKPKLMKADFRTEGSSITTDKPELVDWLIRFGTPTTIDVTSFDAVILVGLAFTYLPAVRIAQTRLVTGWPDHLHTLMQATLPADKPPITGGTYRAILAALHRQSLSCDLTETLRSNSDIPIFIIPRPFPSEDVLKTKQHPIVRQAAKQGNGHAIAQDLTAATNMAVDHVVNAIAVPQPAQTIRQGFLTDPRYMRGARRLDLARSQPDQDVMHANSDLGRMFLTDIVAHLRL